ncbi:MAG: anthranilate synthase component 2 [Haloarculaceae archaeon]|jgi:anthranilate synthase component 2
MRVLVVDNYDSFAYNLVQYVGEVVTDETWLAEGTDSENEVLVRRNDDITPDGIDDLAPDAIVVSPGPGTPQEAGVSVPLFARLSYPTLGVCLGHQALCAANGADVGHAEAVVHGKPSIVSHDGTGIFVGLPDRIEVGRYHSLAVDRETVPEALVETARTVDVAEGESGSEDEEANASGSEDDATGPSSGDESVVMAVRHRERPHVGVQFHPESILTDAGKRLVANFLTAYASPARASDGS